MRHNDDGCLFTLVGIPTVILVYALISFFSSHSLSIDNDEYALEYVSINDYSYCVVHKRKCLAYDPFFKQVYKINDFVKRKYYKYCEFCVYEDDVKFLDGVSRSNIILRKSCVDYEFETGQDPLEHAYLSEFSDSTERGYNVHYVIECNHEAELKIHSFKELNLKEP